MDKKSANGFQSKSSEGGVQRKQLPYSVETPYGFHLDLDFLKYVDDIEKGNTIKRVHIQRRIRGPPKFSTLPRNFSLPGHGTRPALKEKDSTWSATSTLGPKPRSRVTEVQQIFDFRSSDGGTSIQSSRGTTSFVAAKPRDEAGTGPQRVEETQTGTQGRPNLLRASSMPVTLQQRRASDSSSPDRIVGTPENGSSENMLRASPDVPERRCVPQDRAELHQQITVALKRVRELEEQVKTIPELKAQICSLREERHQLLLQLQAHAQAHVSTTPSVQTPNNDAGTNTQSQGHGASEKFNSPVINQRTGGADASKSAPEKESVIRRHRASPQEKRDSVKSSSPHGKVSEQKTERQTQPSEVSDKQKEIVVQAAQTLAQNISGHELTSLTVTLKNSEVVSTVQGGTAAEDRKRDSYPSYDEDLIGVQKLQEKLLILETKLTQANQELEKTNTLLKKQIEDNKVKEETILQLSEGMRLEISATETHSRVRRQSIDRGTETERPDFANQETETEVPAAVDQGTDTDRICVEVCVPKPRTGGTDQGTVIAKADTEVTETGTDIAALGSPRPRADSMERGTETEKVITQDQMTETLVAERVNRVTETEGEMVTDHPFRPRASSVERGTETERVDTVDRLTETEVAPRTDQQTETETERQLDNNPTRDAEAESHVREAVGSQREGRESVEDKKVSESIQSEKDYSDVILKEPITESSAEAAESVLPQTLVLDIVVQDEGQGSQLATKEESSEAKIKENVAEKASGKKNILPESALVEVVEPQKTENEVKKQTTESEIVCATIKETVVTDTVVVAAENSAVKSPAPVRPQRGRKPTAEQSKASSPQIQASPVRPRRGSRETQGQPSPTQTKIQPKLPAQSTTECQAPAPSASEPQGQQSSSQKKIQPKAPVEVASPVLGHAPSAIELQIQVSKKEVTHETPVQSEMADQTQMMRSPAISSEEQSRSQSQTEPKGQIVGSITVQTRPQSIQTQSQSQASETKRDSKEIQRPHRGSSVSQPPIHGIGDAQVRPTRKGSTEIQAHSQDSRRGSSETQPPRKDATEPQSRRRGSSEAAQRRGSGEVQGSRRDTSETQPPRRGSGESPTSPAALGQVVTRITGLLGEQWAHLGSGSGAQQPASQQESPNTQKQTLGKRAEAGKGTSAKPVGKAVPAATTGKPAGKPGPSKMSSIQSQLVSSLSVLSAFYSPGQKAAAASKQQEQGLKSIMKKNGNTDKQGNKGAKKNLKFVGVNGGYETTSSEESSGDEKSKVEVEEEEKSKPKEEKEPQSLERPEEETQSQQMDVEVLPQEGGAAAAEEKEGERGLLDPEDIQEMKEEQAEGEQVDKGFIDACIYVKDRMEEVSSPDKEMRQVLVVLYQEWFRVSSQKDSQADTVRLYLRRVGLTTPTLLPYVVNLTDGNGNMALHYSVSHSNFSVVKLLLDTGLCETDNVNKAGYTPVMLAALTAAESPDDLEVAQQLLRIGDVNARSRQAGQTALMLAVSHGRVAMVKLLLSCGADVNAQDREGSTALMCASEYGHTHIARLLLETGCCDSSLTDKNGQTALAVAEGASHQDIIDLLKAHAETSEPPSTTDHH